MHLTPEQVADMQRLIQGHYLALAIELYGADALPPEAVESAMREGLLTPAYVAQTSARGVAGDAYLLGYETQRNPAVARAAPEDFQARADDLHADLSDWERRMARAARQRGAQLVVGLGNTVATDFTTTAISSDNELAQRYRRIIAEDTASAIEARESWRRLRGTLGESLGEDWARNLHRIAATEIQAAVNAGIADAIEEQEGHKAQVAVIPNDDACPVCLKMYLTGGKPRIFALGDLAPYGANFKKPQAQWVATVPPLHPWCFPAGTPVLTARGNVPIEQVRLGDLVLTHEGRWRRVNEVRRKRHDGDLVVLETPWGRLMPTPNHEIRAASSRWHCAGHIEGSLDVSAAPPEIALPEAQDTPPEAREEGRLPLVLLGFARGGVPVAAIDLHGQLLVGVRQVDEVATDLVARLRGDPSAHELVEEDALQIRLQFAGLLGSAADYRFFRLDAAAPGFVRGLRHRLALGFSEGRVAGALSGAGVALLQPGSLDGADDSTAGDAELPSDGQHGLALVEVHGHDGLRVCDARVRHTDAIALPSVTVNNAGRVPFAGDVFNLGVAEDHSYVAGGIVVHNCHCQLVYVADGWTFDETWTLQPPHGAISQAERVA